MDRLETMRIFVAVADRGSFAEAARRLDLASVQVTRAVALLEERLGTRLIHRTTRRMRLTEAGERYLEDCRRLLREIEEAEESLEDASTPRGILTVTAPVLFGQLHVQPILLDYLAAYPQVRGRMQLSDQVVNLLEEGVEVAVRIGHDRGGTTVGEVRRVTCAAPSYLAEHGTPERLEDLAEHTLIATAPGDWLFFERGKPRTMGIRPRLTINHNGAAIDAAVAGFGLTRVLSYQVVPQLADGRLQAVLPDLDPPPWFVQVMAEPRSSARVGTFVDFLVPRLSERLSERHR